MTTDLQKRDRVDQLETLLLGAARRWDTVRPVYQPYVDGLDNLPRDGRFLLVANHTASPATEILLLTYEVQRELGIKVRPLMDRRFGNAKGLQGDILAAGGGIVGSPDGTRDLMSAGEPILVFPGGAREIGKAKGEEYTLLWGDRAGFARLAVENDYPIVTAATVGGDDVFKILTTRDSAWMRVSKSLAERFGERSDMTMPLFRGIGPTLIPRPQRLYARFSAPIDTRRPQSVDVVDWVQQIRGTAEQSLEADLAHLQQVRSTDPFRSLAPWAWGSAVMP